MGDVVTTIAGAAAGVLAVAAVVLVVAGVRGADVARSSRAVRGDARDWRRLAAGAVSGGVVLVATRWVAVAVAVGGLVAVWPRIFGGARSARRQIDLLDALAAWTESLRDMVATGIGLPEALPASASAASPLLIPALSALVDRLHAREPLADALRGFADDLDDVTADLVVAALLLNANAQGRQLHAVLSSLATSTRAELAMRRTVQADRRATRRGVQIVLVVTVVMALGLRLLNPSYVAPYQNAVGQLVLAAVVALFAVGFIWLHRLSRLPVPARFILHDTTSTGETTAIWVPAVESVR